MKDEQRKPHILIVDDIQKNIQVLGVILEKQNYQVSVAMNGQQALKQVQRVIPDLILLDVMMPEMDGFETCRNLKCDPATRDVPIIFLTAKVEVDDIVKGFELGAVDYVTKPFNHTELLARVKTHLQLKMARDEIEVLIEHKTCLTNMIVHDINNLLTINLSSAEFILMNESITPKIEKYALKIKKTAKDIYAMGKSLLDVEKFESGEMGQSIENIDFYEQFQQKMQLLADQAEEKNIILKVSNDADETVVLADRDLLTRVIENLFFNALKFCPNGGTIESLFCSNKETCTLAVMNDSKPIPSEFHGKIFEKFGQIEVSKKIAGKGVGLGLTFCQMAVKSMNGSISVESPISGREDGVKFIVNLPVIKP